MRSCYIMKVYDNESIAVICSCLMAFFVYRHCIVHASLLYRRCSWSYFVTTGDLVYFCVLVTRMLLLL